MNVETRRDTAISFQAFPAWARQVETLLEIQKSGVELIKPFDEQQIDCNCYTLRMGDHYFVTSAKGDAEPPTKTKIAVGDDFNIPPGQFAFLISEEEVFIPHFAMAFISMRTSFKFRGLVNVSGFHVDPGYKGKLIFAAFNASPITVQLTGGERLFKIWFTSINQTSGKNYVFDKQPVKEIEKELLRGMTRELLSLQQLNDKIRDVDDALTKKLLAIDADVKTKLAEQKPTVDNLQTIWRTITIGVIAALLLALLTAAMPPLLILGNWMAQQISETRYPTCRLHLMLSEREASPRNVDFRR
jgi:dCTP deaminase